MNRQKRLITIVLALVALAGCEKTDAVQRELEVLQFEARTLRNLKTQMKIANRMLRESKQQIQPVLKANGFAFHGYAIRKTRK